MGRYRQCTFILLVCVLLSGIFAVSPVQEAAAAGSVLIKNPQFVSGSTVLSVIQTGTVTGKVEVQNNTSTPQSAILVTALQKTGTNELVEINSQKVENIAAGATQPLTAGVNVQSTDGYYVALYVWNSAEQAQPWTQVYTLTTLQENTPPEKPVNLIKDADTANFSINYLPLKWDVPEDNSGIITSYTVKRDNVSIADVAGATYNDPGIMAGRAYNYTILAKDPLGAATASDPVSLKLDGATAIFSDNNGQLFGFSSFINNTTWGESSQTIFDGVPCRMLPVSATTDKRLHLKLDDTVMNALGSKFAVKITYYDNGTDRFRWSYSFNSTNTNYWKNVEWRKTNTNKWITYVSPIVTDAKWGHLLDSSTDFVIVNYKSSLEPTYVSKIELIKIPQDVTVLK